MYRPKKQKSKTKLAVISYFCCFSKQEKKTKGQTPLTNKNENVIEGRQKTKEMFCLEANKKRTKNLFAFAQTTKQRNVSQKKKG